MPCTDLFPLYVRSYTHPDPDYDTPEGDPVGGRMGAQMGPGGVVDGGAAAAGAAMSPEKVAQMKRVRGWRGFCDDMTDQVLNFFKKP
jgi:hypothetical protein